MELHETILETLFLKDQTEKRALEQSKIQTLKRVGTWKGAISEMGNPEGCDTMGAKEESILKKRQWWSAKS